MAPMLALVGLRWTAVAAALSTVAAESVRRGRRRSSWWWLVAGLAGAVQPARPDRRSPPAAPGCCCAACAGAATRAAARCTCGCGPPTGSPSCRGATWSPARPGRPATPARSARRSATTSTCTPLRRSPGCSSSGRGAAVEPEVDLAGHWVDGDVVHIGKIRIGAGARVGARSTLMPGARVGKGAEIVAGSTVRGAVPAGQRWSGSPAGRIGKSALSWPAEPAAALPVLGGGLRRHLDAARPAPGDRRAARPGPARRGHPRRPDRGRGPARRAAGPPLATLAYLLGYALLVLAGVRLLASAWSRATTRCTAGSAGRCGPPSG